MIKLHADKISISRLIDIEAEFVCKTGEREAVEIKRNLVSPVAQFVPLPSELRYGVTRGVRLKSDVALRVKMSEDRCFSERLL